MAFAAAARRAAASAAALVTGALNGRANYLSTWRLFRGSTGPFRSLPFSSMASDAALLRAIDPEIKFAEESDDHYRVGEVPERFPFDMKDDPGKATIVLTRNYDGENIEVTASMPNLITEEFGDEDDSDVQSPAQSSIPLIVKVSKGNEHGLVFRCTAFPDEVSIDSMTVWQGGGSEQALAFKGPEFSEIDEDLQKAFHRYLDIRGISPANMNFLHEHMINKDSREYLLWLKNLKTFIDK